MVRASSGLTFSICKMSTQQLLTVSSEDCVEGAGHIMSGQRRAVAGVSSCAVEAAASVAVPLSCHPQVNETLIRGSWGDIGCF